MACTLFGAAMRVGWPALIAAGVAALLAGCPARGAELHDHENARVAVERGEALPLSTILAKVRDKLGGEVAGVRFERKHGRWVYEFRVIAAGGHLAERHVDAATAEIVEKGGR